MNERVLEYLRSVVLAEHGCKEVNMCDIEKSQEVKDLGDMIVNICDEIECDQCDFCIKEDILEVSMLSVDAVYYSRDKSDFYKLIQIANSVSFSEKDGNLLTVFKIPKFW